MFVRVRFCFLFGCIFFCCCRGYANIPDISYVSEIVYGLEEHVQDTDNPHAVSAAQVGLGNVKNVDTTDASNLTSGTVDVQRLPVGTDAGTVAAGDDFRFSAIPTNAPSAPPPAGYVYIWFE